MTFCASFRTHILGPDVGRSHSLLVLRVKGEGELTWIMDPCAGRWGGERLDTNKPMLSYGKVMRKPKRYRQYLQ